MAALNMSVKHGQTFEAAKANFARGVTAAGSQYGQYIKAVEWSADRTSARLSGSGFAVDLSVDADAVHATGQVPFFVRFMEGPIRKFVEKALQSD